jgi:WD40 repeat protein
VMDSDASSLALPIEDSQAVSQLSVSSVQVTILSTSTTGSRENETDANINDSTMLPRRSSDTVTDVSSLCLPGLYHSSHPSQPEESRNDHENNSAGTGCTLQSTASPCFKQDVSRHLLPTHTVSLMAPVELSQEQLQHHQRLSSRTSIRSTPYIAVADDNASIESGLTTDEVLISIQQDKDSISPTSREPPSYTNASLEERTEQIIMEARLQSSRSNAVNKRTEEILQELRLTSSSTRTSITRAMSGTLSIHSGTTIDGNINSRRNSLESLQQSNDYQDGTTTSVDVGLNTNTTRRRNLSSGQNSNPVSASRSASQIQRPLEEGTITHQSSLSSTRSPKESLSTLPSTTERQTTVTVDDTDITYDDPSCLFRTRSTEEVLELATSLLHEAQIQMGISNAMEPVDDRRYANSVLENYNSPELFSTPPRRTTSATHKTIDAPPTNSVDGEVSDFQILSPSDSDIASLDDFDKAVDKLPSRFTDAEFHSMSREKILRKLDDMPMHIHRTSTHQDIHRTAATNLKDTTQYGSTPTARNNFTSLMRTSAGRMKQAPLKPVVIKSLEVKQQPEDVSTIGSWFNYLLGTASKDTESEDHNSLEAFAVPCGSPQAALYEHFPAMGASLARTTNLPPASPSYPEIALASRKMDEKLQQWVENQFKQQIGLPEDGRYQLGESKSIVVHEIIRGNWTWSTAWSPDGNRLAIATENHHLAVVETTSSTVWRVKHDRRAKGPQKNGTTQSIRSIAWGDHYIAIGGTGNAVSILGTADPFPILHTITPTGFVGTMDWLPGTNKLIFGSRLGKAILLDISVSDDRLPVEGSQIIRDVQSTVLHIIDREKAWVNGVQFNRDGSNFAVGDSKGILGVYSLKCNAEDQIAVTNIANFKLEDSILDLEWSADSQYLYAGGEDFSITVIATQHWEPVHRIKRDRWVQFVSSSHGSSHVAVGGVSSEVSILEVNKGWENVINVGLKGLVPLSAKWHPRDQYLVLTGQNHSILAIETSNARHVTGHFLRSVYGICSIAFSPDGRMAAVGNATGIVTLFTLSSTTFICAYEMVIDCNGSLSMEWSQNEAYIAIAAGNKVVIVARTDTLQGSAPPKTSGFFVAKVVKDLGDIHDVSIDPTSRFVAASGTKTRILDATSNFKTVLEMENGGTTLSNSWSPDGHWFAVIGVDHSLVIYDTSPMNLSRWQSVFTVKTNQAGLALAWGPSSIEGLQYCAYGGEDKHISVVEIRTKERTWETVIDIPREGDINDLDWNDDGLVAAAIGNGSVTILDLSYLQSGYAVNEMDYNWQRQALTCFTEIRRNKGKHSMKTVRWIPSICRSESLLAFGGTDGELEILDLTERHRCKGFQSLTENN